MKRIYYLIVFAIALISCEKPISEFQSENFIKFFGSGYESKGNDVIELVDGGYVITGYDKQSTLDNQIFVAKVDKNGNLAWRKTSFGKSDIKEEGKVVKEVSDGFLIAGTSARSGITHSLILKISLDGDSLWYKEFSDADYNITVNDIVTADNNIYVAGYSDASKIGSTDYYISKLDNLGETVWEKSFSIGKNSSFRKIFIREGNLLAVGKDGIENRISIVSISQSTGIPSEAVYLDEQNEKAADASLVDNQLYVLSAEGTSSTKLSKLDSNYEWVWDYKSSSPIIAKAFTYQVDGSLMVCGETIVEGNSLLHFIKINPDGTLYKDEGYFKTFGGNVERIIETRDNGLIMVGSTTPTYGMNIQLIKTDKDYFMLKK
ncbi:MAG: hypothetical protein EHM93_15535 [Bacteroidales bacterium]|nr:MAG: hypothetical protein EHM93_15535 [Bacteroidales bacterium]